MRPTSKLGAIAIAIAIAIAVAVGAAGCTSQPDTRASLKTSTPLCVEHSVTVTLSTDDPTAYHVTGWLCRPTLTSARTQTVELLVSGLTYDHTYWDSPYQPDRYSYVRAASEHGYTTFNIDRLGVGRSDHPAADKLTLPAHAHTIAQIIMKLRTGQIGGHAFHTVVGVGHSMGAGILQFEAGTVTAPGAAPDYLVLAGYLSATNPLTLAQIGASLYPATGDTRFALAALPSGYLTTRPGSRQALFFTEGDADPAQVAMDEALKQTSTLAERTTVSAARNLTITQAIHTPVLTVVGQHDALACDESYGLSCATPAAILARENSHFAPSACLSAYILPGAGHSTNLHRNARDSYDHINAWLNTHIAAASHTPNPICP